MKTPNLPSAPRFPDHRGRWYTLEGGVGAVMSHGTRARVWIWTWNKRGQRLFSNSIRLDLPTARLFAAELNAAIADAEIAEVDWRAMQAELRVLGDPAGEVPS